MNKFIEISSKIGISTIDWIRSIYFSLFGSSALAFGLKVCSLEKLTAIYFGLAILCFLIGLFLSVKITNRFKKYEKRFDKENPSNVADITHYYRIQDINYPYQHFFLYFLFIPAFFFIIIAGHKIENKSMDNTIKVLNNEAKIDSSLERIETQNHNLNLKVISLEEKLLGSKNGVNVKTQNSKKQLSKMQ
ncbi:MAG: hypothetical protein LCH54_03805 [Bacteroidetes bacterium]|nr:hypothetical protein [Bacteroidota bacterium]